MNPFRRQLIEEAWANIGEWLTPIQEDGDGLHFLLFDPWHGAWQMFRPKLEEINSLYAVIHFRATGYALAKLVEFEDPEAVADGYKSAYLLPSIAKCYYNQEQINERFQIISDWIDQHPYAATRMAELESEMARDGLGRVALTTLAGVVRPDGAVEAPQRRM